MIPIPYLKSIASLTTKIIALNKRPGFNETNSFMILTQNRLNHQQRLNIHYNFIFTIIDHSLLFR